MDKLFNISNVLGVVLNPDLTLYLQSILNACKIGDIQTLINLRSEIKDFLNIEQQDLMRVLIDRYENE